jgi:RNA polymerase sigma-70 factor (ECF subfamily)
MRYFDRIYSYLRLLYRNAHQAEDATQQVFVKLLEVLPTYDAPPRRFRGWLFAVSRNHALNELRRDRRSETTDADALLREEPSDPYDGGLTALEWISDHDLNLFVERLPLAQRQVIFLRYVVGLETSEVAEILGQTSELTRKQHSRALAFLRHRLRAVGRDTRRGNRVPARVLVRKTPVVRRRRFSLIAH